MISLLQLVTVILGLAVTRDLRAEPSNKIVTMNVHCYLDNWEFRFQKILDYLMSISPDVIAFQEVCTNPKAGTSQIDFIRNYLAGHGYPVNSFEAQYTHRAWDQFDEYVLMISKHQNQKVDKGFLPQSILQRGYVALNIDGNWYVNLHLEYRAEDAQVRNIQLDFIRQRFVNSPHMVMGDFNSSPESSEQSDLWDSGYAPVFPGPSHAEQDNKFDAKIDGYWLSPGIQNRLAHYDGKIVLKEKVDGQQLSDHFAVLLNFGFR
jgi:endonuclease/exonuclease/phosphatase family metal-dependent hydrolase